ncbi:hypothetical protein [Streptomyces sp. NPDC050560]|uniref:hypothetical protein n=1 Tax=Streptomyces sp. NPDC050560 TaxID=3365630 RepID=UPI00378B91F5
MLIAPRPGADRRNIRQALRAAHVSAGNEQSANAGSAVGRLLHYPERATDTARALSSHDSDKDVDQLVLTHRYHALLAGRGTLAGTAQECLVNGLVNLELTESIDALERAEK